MQQHQQLFQTSQQGGFIQNGLFILIFQQQIGRHVLAQVQRTVRGYNVIHHILGDLRTEGEIFLKAIPKAADECLGLGTLVGTDAFHRCAAHHGLHVLALILQLQQAGAVFALHQNLYKILGHAQHLTDLRHHTVGIQIPQTGFLHIHLLLCHKEYAAVAVHGSLDGSDGFGAAHLKMDHIVGKHHQPAQRDHWQMLHIAGNFDLDLFRHSFSPPLTGFAGSRFAHR